MKSILLKNAKIIENGKVIDRNILIEDNKITDITEDMLTVDRVIDIKGNIILPGLIDSHVHFREPGLTHKEDFFTGSCAAAKGGVTTILDMPNTIPATTTAELLSQKRELAKKSIVNYGFHFGCAKDNLEEIKKAQDIASVKVYMDETTGSLAVNDDSVLEEIFENCKKIAVHAEGGNVFKAIKLMKDRQDKKGFLYLCHISREDEIKIIKRGKSARLYTELTPHHLFLTKEDEKNAFFRMKPTLKAKQDQDALWDALNKGLIDTIASDHAPHTIEEKQSNNPPYGVPGVETTLPLLLDAINKKRFDFEKLIRLCCENPAKIFKIRGKGKIAVGYDADLVVVDMNLEKEIRNEELLTKCKWSPFNGKLLKGWPIMTFVNGNIVYENGKINGIKAKEIKYELPKIIPQPGEKKIEEKAGEGIEEEPEEEKRWGDEIEQGSC